MPFREDESPSEPAPAEHRLILAGFGGQGILTLGKLLCMAAMSEGKNVTYLPSYGSEVRGGTANCQVVVSSDGIIYSPLVEQADSLVIFNQLSYELFVPRLKPGGFLLLNSSGVERGEVPGTDVLALPAAEMAAEMGNVRVTNVLMLGAYVRATGLVSEESCRSALKELLGARQASLLQLNLRAFHRGAELAESGPYRR